MMSRVSLTAAAALLCAGAHSTPGRAAVPTQASILIDGDLSDWALVWLNPANTSRDGDGSTVPCGESTDRNCPLAGPWLDLARFAWTWDETALYFSIEVHADAIDKDLTYRLHLDADAAGLMELGEPMIKIGLPKDGSAPGMKLDTYTPFAIGGDPLVDASGWADGYLMPGGSTVGPGLADPGRVPGTNHVEAAVPWAALGLAPGAGLNYHLTCTENLSIDTMGGAGGGLGTTANLQITVEPDFDVGVAAGDTLRLVHRLTNAGNLPARLNVSAVSSCGHDLRFEQDFGAVGALYLGTDAGGNGRFLDPGDELTVLGDENADALLDTGLLLPGESFDLAIEQAYPVDSTCTLGRVDVHVEVAGDASVAADAVEIIRIGSFTLTSAAPLVVAPGQDAWFPHAVANHGALDSRVQLWAGSLRGWTYSFELDADGDGLPGGPGDLPLDDTDADGSPDFLVPAGEARRFLARTQVPVAAPPTLQEQVLVRASPDSALPLSVQDELTVGATIDLSPHYLQLLGDARYGGAGDDVFFSHRLVNGLGRAETFTLEAVADLGWQVSLFRDPDGDGRPYDAQPLVGSTALVGAGGGVFDFLVRVRIPVGALQQERSQVSVTATADTDSSVSAWVLDDAVAAIVRVHEDPAFVFNTDSFPPCATVHAKATGLTPLSLDYRFAWRDPSGSVFRLQPVATTGAGETEDALVLGGADLAAGFSLDIQEFDGVDHVTLDTAAFDVEDPIDLQGLATAEPVHEPGPTSFLAGADLVNLSPLLRPEDLTLRWVVLSPDGGSYLDAGGVFRAYTGSEATRVELLDLVERASVQPLVLSVANADLAVEGTHELQVWGSYPCTGERLLSSTSFLVDADLDGDGLTRVEEEAAGTDPRDADSDDDGLPDGLDGTGDSDGDGVIDALDCDSDDDGLTDGLEAGVDLAPPDTDLAAGCFTPDQDPSTTTNPDAPDSDSGGVSDGAEDGNGNGRFDAGEGDPNDPADDVPACPADPPPEVADLRLAAEAAAVRLRWSPVPDDCVSYAVLVGDAPFGLGEAATGLSLTEHLDPAPLGPSGVRYYLVRADGAVSGPGPTGR